MLAEIPMCQLPFSEAFVEASDSIVRCVIEGAAATLGLRESTGAVVDIMGGGYAFDVCSVWLVDPHLGQLKGKIGVSRVTSLQGRHQCG